MNRQHVITAIEEAKQLSDTLDADVVSSKALGILPILVEEIDRLNRVIDDAISLADINLNTQTTTNTDWVCSEDNRRPQDSYLALCEELRNRQ